jgi:hypothetical protein
MISPMRLSVSMSAVRIASAWAVVVADGVREGELLVCELRRRVVLVAEQHQRLRQPLRIDPRVAVDALLAVFPPARARVLVTRVGELPDPLRVADQPPLQRGVSGAPGAGLVDGCRERPLPAVPTAEGAVHGFVQRLHAADRNFAVSNCIPCGATVWRVSRR